MRKLALAAVLALAGTLVIAPVAVADDYPSWDEVQAAKADQAASQREVDRINAFIAQLTAESARLGKVTIEKAAAAADAQAKLDEAVRRSDRLAAAATQAQTDADAAKARYGGIVSQLVTSTGGQDLTLRLMLDGTASEDLLYQLGAISKLTQQAAYLEQAAHVKQNEAVSLRAQADVAKQERDKLAVAAQQALAEAQAAEKAANDKLAEQQAASQTLYAQLAVLTGRAADVEQRYAIGQEARRKAEEAAAAAGGGGGGGSINTGDVVVDPAGAKAYARGAIGAYGWGASQFDCLVLLWNRESGWRANAYNASSGAYGIPQSLPAEKMASAGPDWRTNGNTQIDWGLGYIDARYGSPCGAWAHSQATGWY